MKKLRLKELYAQLESAQQDLFNRMYKSIDLITPDKVDWAIQQCEATIRKNKEKAGIPTEPKWVITKEVDGVMIPIGEYGIEPHAYDLVEKRKKKVEPVYSASTTVNHVIITDKKKKAPVKVAKVKLDTPPTEENNDKPYPWLL